MRVLILEESCHLIEYFADVVKGSEQQDSPSEMREQPVWPGAVKLQTPK